MSAAKTEEEREAWKIIKKKRDGKAEKEWKEGMHERKEVKRGLEEGRNEIMVNLTTPTVCFTVPGNVNATHACGK